MTVLGEITHDRSFLEAFRRNIHAHSELGLEEHRTSEAVASALESLGIEVHRGIGRTGVVGVLRAGNGAGTIGLRAEPPPLPKPLAPRRSCSLGYISRLYTITLKNRSLRRMRPKWSWGRERWRA